MTVPDVAVTDSVGSVVLLGTAVVAAFEIGALTIWAGIETIKLARKEAIISFAKRG